MTNPLEQRTMGLALFINHFEKDIRLKGYKLRPEVRKLAATIWAQYPYQQRKRHIVHITKSNRERRIR